MGVFIAIVAASVIMWIILILFGLRRIVLKFFVMSLGVRLEAALLAQAP